MSPRTDVKWYRCHLPLCTWCIEMTSWRGGRGGNVTCVEIYFSSIPRLQYFRRTVLLNQSASAVANESCNLKFYSPLCNELYTRTYLAPFCSHCVTVTNEWTVHYCIYCVTRLLCAFDRQTCGKYPMISRLFTLHWKIRLWFSLWRFCGAPSAFYIFASLQTRYAWARSTCLESGNKGAYVYISFCFRAKRNMFENRTFEVHSDLTFRRLSLNVNALHIDIVFITNLFIMQSALSIIRMIRYGIRDVE